MNDMSYNASLHRKYGDMTAALGRWCVTQRGRMDKDQYEHVLGIVNALNRVEDMTNKGLDYPADDASGRAKHILDNEIAAYPENTISDSMKTQRCEAIVKAQEAVRTAADKIWPDISSGRKVG